MISAHEVFRRHPLSAQAKTPGDLVEDVNVVDTTEDPLTRTHGEKTGMDTLCLVGELDS